MTKKPTIGFIGAGLMGHGIAKNLLLAGYPLILMGHKNRAPIDDLVRQGAVEAHSPGEIAGKVDMLFLCVTSSAVVETVMSGDDGIIQAGRPGLIVVDTSTGDPAATIALGARLSARGIHLVDAPLTRTPREAEEGRLNILISGKPDIVAQVHAVATSFCENIFEIGELGSALKLKLINNLLSLSHAVLAAEAVNAARRQQCRVRDDRLAPARGRRHRHAVLDEKRAQRPGLLPQNGRGHGSDGPAGRLHLRRLQSGDPHGSRRKGPEPDERDFLS
jgi:hypothetical protein